MASSPRASSPREREAHSAPAAGTVAPAVRRGLQCRARGKPVRHRATGGQYRQRARRERRACCLGQERRCAGGPGALGRLGPRAHGQRQGGLDQGELPVGRGAAAAAARATHRGSGAAQGGCEPPAGTARGGEQPRGGATAPTAALTAAVAAEDAAAAPPALFAAAEEENPRRVWPWALGAGLLALCVGFALGALVLDRHIRRKYGGLRIY